MHLTDEEIALFIDKSYADIDVDGVVEHLKRCRRCFDLYRDSARDSAVWSMSPGEFALSAEIANVGKAVASRDAVFQEKPNATDGSRRSHGGWRYAVAVVTVALVVAAAVVFFGEGDRREAAAPDHVVGTIQIAVESAAPHWAMIIPGGEMVPAKPTVVYRSGAVVENDSLRSAIKRLIQSYEPGSPDVEVARWLIRGLLATGQIDAAGDYTRDARQAHPNDTELTMLGALIAFRDGDYAGSERLLVDVVAESPGNAVAMFNLAVALYHQGRSTEASDILAQIMSGPGPLAHRVDSLQKMISAP